MATFVYVSVAGEDKISILYLDPRSGQLELRSEVAAPSGPAPLAVAPDLGFLYVGLRSSCEIASFAIDAGTGSLLRIGTVPLDADPCYMATDRSGRFLLSAYYRAGKVGVHRIGQDGAVCSPAVQWVPTAPMAHCIMTDRSNRFAFVPHPAGPNLIFQFTFDAQAGRLSPNAVPRVIPEAGVGPRHYCFHPRQDIVYLSNEQGSSVTAYRLDTGAGTLSPFQMLSTLPAGYSGENTCAQIHVTPAGRFLYVSNRGHDSIAIFAIDEDDGRLRCVGQEPTEKTPRVFNVDPAGRYLFVAGQGTGRLASYRIDDQRGTLALLARYAVGENPMWVLALDLPGADGSSQ